MIGQMQTDIVHLDRPPPAARSVEPLDDLEGRSLLVAGGMYLASGSIRP
jgi:hypothetical protein